MKRSLMSEWRFLLPKRLIPKRESTKISSPVVSEMIKAKEKVKLDESEKLVVTDALPVPELKTKWWLQEK